MSQPRIIAIDWSGALNGAARKIWLCEVIDGEVARLECGRDRAEIEALLLDEARRDGDLVVGLDFAFSMPAWFMREQGFASAHDLWAALPGGLGERWLRGCEPPFWGRPAKRRPAADLPRPAMRRCERDIGAKSVFQIGGAGAVGTGSLRGMPMLHRLHVAGFHIWPYDDLGLPLVVEIYPRLFTGPVRKSSREARERYVTQHGVGVQPPAVKAAIDSDDAFDALFSALAMWRHRSEFKSLPGPGDAIMQLEGEIWRPSTTTPHERFTPPSSIVHSPDPLP